MSTITSTRTNQLLEQCEPLFLYICRLNRSGRKGGPSFDKDQVRNEVKSIVREIGESCREAGLESQFAKVRVILLGFADYMIENSNLSFAGKWRRILHEENNYAGDEQFFHPADDKGTGKQTGISLDETLADPSTDATQRLAIFYTCLGLGFGGMYKDEPQTLNMYMARIAPRLSDIMDADQDAPISPEAYKYTKEGSLQTPLTAPLLGATVAVVGLILLAFVVNGALYYMRTSQLKTDLGVFEQAANTAASSEQPSSTSSVAAADKD